jgi:uncharacterized protein YvpB
LLDPCASAGSGTGETLNHPWKAVIAKIYGHAQSLPLDCESRSAVDWAAYFGKSINELEFFRRLPVSANPDEGFVGDVYGPWGNLPPLGYGVDAGPVARLLRTYGLSAHAYRGMSWNQLQAEAAAGRPVEVWVVGHIGYSAPVMLELGDGTVFRAARYEHTVLIVGYEGDKVYILDGAWRYAVSVNDFLRSWRVLNSMGIVRESLSDESICQSNTMELFP